MRKHDLSWKPEPEDIERGYVTRKRYWELVKAAAVSRGYKITDITEVEGAFYLLTTDDG